MSASVFHFNYKNPGSNVLLFRDLVLDPAAILACVFQYHGAQQCSQGPT